MHRQDEILETQLAKLCLTTALDGAPMGTPLRWGEFAVKELGKLGHKDQENILQAQVDAVELATKLAGSDKKTKPGGLKHSEWQQGLHEITAYLKDAGGQHKIPLSFQERVIARAIDDLKGKYDKTSLSVFMTMIVPHAAPGDQFDLLRPACGTTFKERKEK